MNTDMLAPVIAYCTQEVMRQGHDCFIQDGIERVAWMLQAWVYALERDGATKPTVTDVVNIGKFCERYKNANGVRTVGVMVGGRVCPRPEKVNALLVPNTSEFLATYVQEFHLLPEPV